MWDERKRRENMEINSRQFRWSGGGRCGERADVTW